MRRLPNLLKSGPQFVGRMATAALHVIGVVITGGLLLALAARACSSRRHRRGAPTGDLARVAVVGLQDGQAECMARWEERSRANRGVGSCEGLECSGPLEEHVWSWMDLVTRESVVVTKTCGSALAEYLPRWGRPRGRVR